MPDPAFEKTLSISDGRKRLVAKKQTSVAWKIKWSYLDWFLQEIYSQYLTIAFMLSFYNSFISIFSWKTCHNDMTAFASAFFWNKEVRGHEIGYINFFLEVIEIFSCLSFINRFLFINAHLCNKILNDFFCTYDCFFGHFYFLIFFIEGSSYCFNLFYHHFIVKAFFRMNLFQYFVIILHLWFSILR